MSETLPEFRPIPEDIEPEGENQPDLMGFETPQPGNEVGVQGEEGGSPQWGSHKDQPQSQTEDFNITQMSVCQMTEIAVNDEQGTENRNEHPRFQPTEMITEDTQGQNGQPPHNHTDENTGNTIQSNVGNIVTIHLNNNRHDTVNNNTNIPQTSDYRSENSQNYP